MRGLLDLVELIEYGPGSSWISSDCNGCCIYRILEVTALVEESSGLRLLRSSIYEGQSQIARVRVGQSYR